MSLTDLIAALGLILAVVSLTWQDATFILSGRRVRADLKHGARSAGVAVTGVPGSQSLVDLARQGFTEEIFAIEVRNTGRLAGGISRIQIAIANDVQVEVKADLLTLELPFHLEAPHSAMWYVPAIPVRAAVGASVAALKKGSDPTDIWGEAETVGGWVRTRNSMKPGSRPALDRTP